MLFRLAISAFFGLILSLQTATACRIIPTEKNPTRYLRNLVKSTPDIYWVEAVQFSQEDEAFTFKVLENIRGEKKQELVIGGLAVDGITDEKLKALNRSDFKRHRMDEFWKDVVKGRTTLSPNCRLTPRFEIGEKYLVLMKQPFQTRSFEIVKSKNDLWYKYVRDVLYPSKKPL